MDIPISLLSEYPLTKKYLQVSQILEPAVSLLLLSRNQNDFCGAQRWGGTTFPSRWAAKNAPSWASEQQVKGHASPCHKALLTRTT